MARNAAGRMGWKRGSKCAPRRASWMCNRVAHIKEASSEEILTLIDCLHEDNLPVQPVAQRLGIEPLKGPLAPACGGAQNAGTRIFISGLVIPDRWQGRCR